MTLATFLITANNKTVVAVEIRDSSVGVFVPPHRTTTVLR
jgi:hypothetical protein